MIDFNAFRAHLKTTEPEHPPNDEATESNCAEIDRLFLPFYGKWLGLNRTLVKKPPKVVLKAILWVAEYAHEIILPHTACRYGCSHCCYQSVAICGEEAKLIAKKIRAKYRPPRPKIGIRTPNHRELAMGMAADLEVNREKYSGAPCPFLNWGRCSIYDVRPVACRLLYNVSDNPGLCDVRQNPGGTVPYYNLQDLEFIMAMMEAPEVWGDIREFFPEK